MAKNTGHTISWAHLGRRAEFHCRGLSHYLSLDGHPVRALLVVESANWLNALSYFHREG